jgi:hypothetical protein
MKTLQRQNTKREIVKKVRFSKNIADANSGMLKKYAPNHKRVTLDNKEEDGIPRLQTSVIPVAASDSQSSLDTAAVITSAETTTAVAVDTVDDAAESGKSQHENTITLSLTE